MSICKHVHMHDFGGTRPRHHLQKYIQNLMPLTSLQQAYPKLCLALGALPVRFDFHLKPLRECPSKLEITAGEGGREKAKTRRVEWM